MADTIGDFLVRISSVFDDKGLSDAKQAFEQALDPMEAFKGILEEIGLITTAGAAIWGLVDFSKESLHAFGDLEQSSMRLGMALKNLGVFTDETFQRTKEFAEEMERKSTFDKVAIQDTEALLTTFGLYGAKLEEVTKGAMNLSVARHMDLHAAAMLLGRAYDGNTTMLKRFGITIEDTGSAAGNFEQVMRLVNERFGGAAEAEIGTYNGQVAQLHNNFEALKQKIGAELLPVAEAWIDWTRRAIAAGDKLVTSDEHVHRGRQLAIDALEKEKEQLAASLASLSTHGGELVKQSQHYKDLETQIKKVEKAIKYEQWAMLNEPKAQPGKQRFGGPPGDKKQADDKFLKQFEDDQQKQFVAASESLDKEYQKYVSTKESEAQVEADNLAVRLDAAGRHYDALEVLRVRDDKLTKMHNEELKAAARETFGFISTLQHAKSKELVAIGKTAAIAEATINTQVAFTKTLAAFPAPINYALAAAVMAAGMAHVAQIAGVQLAEGGIVQARPGGIQATIGEGGEAEAVAPLSKLRGMIQDAVKGAAGGGAVSVTVNQTVNLGAGGAGQGQDVAQLMEQMRIATKEGVAEAIDAVKQFNLTATQRANEA